MQYEFLDSISRGDVFGVGRLNGLGANLEWLMKAFEREHSADGSHARYSIPRTVFNVDGTTKYGDAPGFVTIVSFASGVLQFKVPSTAFDEDSISVVVQPWMTSVVRPIVVAVKVEDDGAGFIQCYADLRRRTATDANLWEESPTCLVSVAIYGAPSKTTFARAFKRRVAGSKLTNGDTGINALIRGAAQFCKAFSVGHSTAGAHSSGQQFPVASAAVLFDEDTSAYSIERAWGADLAPVTTGTGGSVKYDFVADINTHAIFLSPSWNSEFAYRRSRPCVMMVHEPSTFIYSARWEYSTPGSGGQWRMWDGDVFISIHAF